MLRKAVRNRSGGPFRRYDVLRRRNKTGQRGKNDFGPPPIGVRPENLDDNACGLSASTRRE
jgi:hypothetical protein